MHVDLINHHLDLDCEGPPRSDAAETADAGAAAPPANDEAAPPARDADADKSRYVACPSCGDSVLKLSLNHHLDLNCRGCETPAMATCPLCDQSVPLSEINAHIDSGCGAADSEADVTSDGAAPAPSSARGEADLLELMRGQLTCPLCLDVFDDPACLPCAHTFCRDCILHSFERKDGKHACPVCRLPCRKKSILPASTTRAIVEIYRGRVAAS